MTCKNPDHRREYQRRWRRATYPRTRKEKLKYMKKYYQRNKEARKLYQSRREAALEYLAQDNFRREEEICGVLRLPLSPNGIWNPERVVWREVQ